MISFWHSRNKKYLGGSYDGEKQMGDLATMPLFSSDPNLIVNTSYDLLSTRSTTLYHTYGAGKSAIKKQTEYGIGAGLVFRSQPDWMTLGVSKEEAKVWGKKFQKIVHYYQDRYNFYEKQSKLFNTSMFAGDSWLFFERKDGLLTDLIDTSNDQIDSTVSDGVSYTLGIKHDNLLRKLGIVKTDGTQLAFQDENGYQNVSQFALTEISRQLRGYPLLYSIINLARNDDTFSDAITNRAVMESIIMGVSKTDQTNAVAQARNMARKAKKGLPRDNTKESPLSKISSAIRMGAGSVFDFRTNEDFQFLDIKSPGNNYAPFKEWMLKYVAMGTGTPPEVILSKYESSFTAHKGALNDFVKSYTKKRKTFERSIMDVVVREIAKDAILQGFIDAPGFFDNPMRQHAYLQGYYLAPQPGHINPLVEVKAEAEKVKNAFELRSSVARRIGDVELDDILSEWEEEENKFRSVPDKYIENKAEQVFENETGAE